MRKEWESFRGGIWEKEINVRDFIQKNYTPYLGDDSFLAGPTEDTHFHFGLCGDSECRLDDSTLFMGSEWKDWY